MDRLCVIQGPASGGLGKAGRHLGRNGGCEPMPFLLWLEHTPLVDVLSYPWTLVDVPYLHSSCR